MEEANETQPLFAPEQESIQAPDVPAQELVAPVSDNKDGLDDDADSNLLPLRKLKPIQKRALAAAVNSTIAQEAPLHGTVFYFDMGLGKTIMALSYIQNFQNKNICVFCPNSIQKQWLDAVTTKLELGPAPEEENTQEAKEEKKSEGAPVDEKELLNTKYEIVDARTNTWRIYSYDNMENFAAKIPKDKEDSIIYIFDECHLLSQYMKDARVLDKFKQNYRTICLTGTLIKDSTSNLLYAVNMASGWTTDKGWKFPFTQKGFDQSYLKVRRTKAFLQGWLVALLTLQVAATPVLIKIMDVADFYGSRQASYQISKDRVVRAILRRVPLFDIKITDMQPSDIVATRGLRGIISMMLYYAMLTPFSFILPATIQMFIISKKQKVMRIDTEKLFKDIGPYIQYAGIKYEKDTFLQGITKTAFRKASLPLKAFASIRITTTLWKEKQTSDENTATIPRSLATMEINSTMIQYTKPQIKTFVRFTVNNLTPTERRKLGLLQTDSYTEYSMKNKDLTYEDLITFGLRIGNLSYTQEELHKINKEYKLMSKKKFQELQELSKEAPEGDEKLKPDSEVTKKLKDETENVTNGLSDGKWSSKFEHVLSIIKETNTKSVVYSNFNEGGLKLFYHFLENKDFDMKTVGWLLSTTTDADKTKSDYNDKDGKIKVILLDPKFTEGVDGIRNTTHMFILEPLKNYSQLRQLRARVVRTNSHDNLSENPVVKIFEYASTLYFLQKYLLNTDAIKEWLKNDPEVFYTLRNIAFNQTTTPDEVVLKAQSQQSKFEHDLIKFLDKRPVETPKCTYWTPQMTIKQQRDDTMSCLYYKNKK
jgi:hypothetical protein